MALLIQEPSSKTTQQQEYQGTEEQRRKIQQAAIKRERPFNKTKSERIREKQQRKGHKVREFRTGGEGFAEVSVPVQ